MLHEMGHIFEASTENCYWLKTVKFQQSVGCYSAVNVEFVSV
jgi:hypothetical protein